MLNKIQDQLEEVRTGYESETYVFGSVQVTLLTVSWRVESGAANAPARRTAKERTAVKCMVLTLRRIRDKEAQIGVIEGLRAEVRKGLKLKGARNESTLKRKCRPVYENSRNSTRQDD